jgi:CRP/FNR family cyclic AMP-dependent transcriptional regulator
MTQVRFAKQSFMESLPESDRDALLAIGRRREWQRGEVVVRAGDPADSAIILLEGLTKIHRHGADGTEVVLALSGPGDLLGEITAVRDAVRSATATALAPVRASVLPIRDLRSFLGSHPRATLALLDLALARLHSADARRIEFATSETLGRVTSRLIELAQRFGDERSGAIDVELPITQEELASWSASSRESTARALRTLRELGLIETHRLRLTVLDLGRLSAHTARTY